jgi:hypothetical protein
MRAAAGERQITTIEELEALYGTPVGPALAKEIDGAEHDRGYPERLKHTIY